MTVEQAFRDLLERKINLTQSEREQGTKSQTYARSLLGGKESNDASFPWLLTGDFLSGSYIRGTKLRPLDDIDIMIVLDGQGLSAINNGRVLDATVHGSGRAGSPVTNYIDENGLISSSRILDVFRAALSTSYPNSEIKKDGQAVNVWLDSLGLGLDIVPCFHIQPNDSSQDYYYIPYGRGNPMWMSTNPKMDQRIGDWLHQLHNRNLKAVIRLIKYWNNERNSGRLRSYHT